MNRRPWRGKKFNNREQRPNNEAWGEEDKVNQQGDWDGITDQPSFHRNQNNRRNHRWRGGNSNIQNVGRQAQNTNSRNSGQARYNNFQESNSNRGSRGKLLKFNVNPGEENYEVHEQRGKSYADSDQESFYSTSSRQTGHGNPWEKRRNPYKFNRKTSVSSMPASNDENEEFNYSKGNFHSFPSCHSDGQQSYQNVNPKQNIYRWNRNTSMESLQSHDTNRTELDCSSSSQHEEQYIRNEIPPYRAQDDIDSDSAFGSGGIQSSTNVDNKLDLVENLKSQLNSLMKSVDSADIVKRYRQAINTLSEKYVQRHEENLIRISRCFLNSSNRPKEVWSEHSKVLKLQQSTFERYIAFAKSTLTDVFNVPAQMAMGKCEEILQELKKECTLFKRCLPIYALKEDIRSSLQKSNVTIIVADPCYNVSSVVPTFLLDLCEGGLIVSCSSNIALCYNCYDFCFSLFDNNSQGNCVNYAVGDDTTLSEDTKILFTTTHELFSMGSKDANFTTYSCILFSCALRRTVEADFVLELLRKCALLRKDFKLIIVLQTLQDVGLFKNYFSPLETVNVILTPNLVFPATTVWKTGPPSEDFIKEILETALAIHALKAEGNVLIFLPDVKNFKTVSLSLDTKLHEHDYYDAKCICIYEDRSLKDILSNISQNTKVRRAFFLSTSWALELSIESVSYVIDCGQISDCQYDPVRCLEIKSLTFVSNITAKARKSYAGRNTCGTCYRLYSKRNYKNDMAKREIPDILRENPFDVVMKMFQFRAEDSLNISFVEDLPQKTKENTLMLLKNANAVNERQLTPLGERIIKLPFLPRYSKLIILGIDWDFPFETVLLVAYFLVKRSLFVHNQKKELQQISEGRKLQFLVGDSDTLTFLNVYQKWMATKYDAAWCDSHCLNIKVLQQIQSQTEDILSIVTRRLHASIVPELGCIDRMDWRAIQEIIYDCFRDNLCVYSGHYRSGYRLIKSEYVTFIHPSSPILQKGDLPQFVVFNDVQATSRNFMMNITTIPNDVISAEIEKGVLGKDASRLFQAKLEPFVIDHVGIMFIKRVLLGKKGLKLRAIEDKIKKDTNTDLIVIEPSEENGTVTVYTLPELKEKVEKIVRGMMQEKMQDLLHEKETSPLQLKKSQRTVTVAVTWARGCTVTDLKTSYDHETDPENPKENKTSTSNDMSAIKYSVNLSWPRRLCKGSGFLTFSENDFTLARRLSMTSIQVHGSDANVQISKNIPNQLYISNLHEHTMENDLEEAIRNYLPDHIKVSKSTIVHQKAFKTPQTDIDILKEKLETLCSELKITGDATVVVQMPENNATEMRAFINMTNSADVETGTKVFDGAKLGNLTVKARCVFSATIFCNFEVFKALQDRITQEICQVLRAKLHRNKHFSHIREQDLFQTDVKFPAADTASIKLLSNHIEILNVIYHEMNKLLEGAIVNSKDIKGLHKLFTHGGHLWLRRLEKQIDVHIIEDYKTKILRLYGTLKTCRLAIENIKKFMIDVENELVKVIDLKLGTNTRTLLKELLQKYGFNFKRFVEEFQLRSADLNIRTSKLTLHGNGENIEQAEAAIEKIAQSCSSEAEEFFFSQESCPVCRMPPLQLSIRLEHCGHLYCVQCLKGWISNSAFPILCCQENCDKEIILEDIRKALDYDEEAEIPELLTRAITDYISKNAKHYFYCPAPDCIMFFDKRTETGTKWSCKLCENEICSKCNVIFHHGYTCEIFQGSKNDPDFSFKSWMKERNPNCKQCPRCKTAIEKTQGCNHMTCHSCQCHFCWMCVKAFPTGDDVYRHMPYCINYGK